MTGPPLLRSLMGLAVLAAVATSCILAAVTIGDDLMPLPELVAALVVTAWGVLLVADLWRGNRLSNGLRPLSADARVGLLRVRLIGGGQADAFVIGALQPTIFVGSGLLALLDDEELHAVLLHEEHHRDTRAPLRSAGIAAWIALLGWLPPVRRLLVDRLAELEREADRHAIGRGCSPAALASALVKVHAAAPVTTAFSGSAEQRVSALLGLAGLPSAARPSRYAAVPYEWLLGIAMLVAGMGCHLVGLSAGIA